MPPTRKCLYLLADDHRILRRSQPTNCALPLRLVTNFTCCQHCLLYGVAARIDPNLRKSLIDLFAPAGFFSCSSVLFSKVQFEIQVVAQPKPAFFCISTHLPIRHCFTCPSWPPFIASRQFLFKPVCLAHLPSNHLSDRPRTGNFAVVDASAVKRSPPAAVR